MNYEERKFTWFKQTASEYFVKNGKTQADLAKEMQISPSLISGYLNQNRILPDKHIAKISEIAQVDLPVFYTKLSEEDLAASVKEDFTNYSANSQEEVIEQLKENIRDLRRENKLLHQLLKNQAEEE